ncbi:MAG TPA: MFS transporter [Casimicrobiaceae bacterium]|jgi:PAT family beta-lactamase induction signal transducer AmpG|nr:MFS transporter [Casimicrobiaceae bacterium]
MAFRLVAPPPSPHSVVFLVLILPFGVMAGYLTVTVVYLLTQAGVPIDESAALVAISYLPHSWKFVWAPIPDTTLSRKRWYLLAAVVSALGIFATGAVPPTQGALPLLTVAVLTSNVAVTFLAMSVESLMAYTTPDEAKGRAAGWFQAGNLGGLGLGGGAGLWMAQALPEPWMPGAVLAAVSLACCLALAFVAEPPRAPREAKYYQTLANVAKDLWRVARSRRGFLGLLICFLPIGTGAASNLWSAVAGDWQASADTVALVTGVLNGIVSAAGCLVGGYVCDRMDRKAAYALYGVLMAVCAVAMALAPRTETMYIAFTLTYAFINGLTYAAFSAVALEAIGLGAAATKYNLFASLSNIPIGYMTAADGWAAARWGTAGMLYIEAAVGVLALLVFVAVAALSVRPRVRAA